MEILTLFVIAIGLSMDSFVVSIADGLVAQPLKFEKVLRIALAFAVAQGIMPVIGWFGGISIRVYIEDYDHWIAFALLFIVGVKMIWDSFFKKENNLKIDLKFHSVLLQSIATSIDALAVGISLAVLEVSITYAAVIIGATTFMFSLVGLYLGRYLSGKKSSSFTLMGGVILIIIGIKILYEHLFL